jgi:hypothetical protein
MLYPGFSIGCNSSPLFELSEISDNIAYPPLSLSTPFATSVPTTRPFLIAFDLLASMAGMTSSSSKGE